MINIEKDDLKLLVTTYILMWDEYGLTEVIPFKYSIKMDYCDYCLEVLRIFDSSLNTISVLDENETFVVDDSVNIFDIDTLEKISIIISESLNYVSDNAKILKVFAELSTALFSETLCHLVNC